MPFLPSADTQAALLRYVDAILLEHKSFTDIHTKMEKIDQAYARYQAARNADGTFDSAGVDLGKTPVGVIDLPTTVPPLVVSEVDSIVAYLADVFLTGTPLFPVVSSPSSASAAEMLESVLDDHATLGGYARQLQMLFRDAAKYNFGACEVEWGKIPQYSLGLDETTKTTAALKNDIFFNRLHRLDPYNTIWDHNVLPGDVAIDGDHAGHIKILSRMKIKRLINSLSSDSNEEGMINLHKVFTRSGYHSISADGTPNYRKAPQVSDYVAARLPTTGTDWYSLLGGGASSKEDAKELKLGVSNYELITLYLRIIPADFGMEVPSKKSPQIWKVLVLNGDLIIQCKRVISAYDILPILFAQPIEDGLAYQTGSIAENTIPFQKAATTLMSIKFNAARRAVSDRALYNSAVIRATDINAPVAAPKIPVRINALDMNDHVGRHYQQIPFDSRGTEGVINDASTIISLSRELHGLNNATRGQFQKGNKSVTEWNDVMGNADARLRLPALALEHQFFMPLKEILKLNLIQFGQDTEVLSSKTGEIIQAALAQIRTTTLKFKVADGYTPKSKLASTDALQASLQLLATSQVLQQQLGPMLAPMFVHLNKLMGIKGLEEYMPQQPTQPTQPQAGQPQQPQGAQQ